MSAAEIIRKSNFKPTNSARVFAWLILLCVCCNSLPAFALPPAQSDDSVYCPLQKKWVEKAESKLRTKAAALIELSNPLGEICAPETEKHRFVSALSEQAPLLRFGLSLNGAEKLFFAFVKKGKQAFAAAGLRRSLPEPQFAESAAAEKSIGGNYRFNLDKSKPEVFALAHAARPPTTEKIRFFQTFAFRRLEIVSRRIQPRAPPVSL